MELKHYITYFWCFQLYVYLKTDMTNDLSLSTIDFHDWEQVTVLFYFITLIIFILVNTEYVMYIFSVIFGSQ